MSEETYDDTEDFFGASYDADDLSLVEDNFTSSTTDAVTDLKTGIYNLFISLFHHHVPTHGLEGAIVLSTDYLEEIIVNFRQILQSDDPDSKP